MIVSTKGRYALRVMIDLAEHQAERYVPLKEVAERQEISEKYLENILKVLVQNGCLEGLRGKGGGYRLTRTPDQYTVAEILSRPTIFSIRSTFWAMTVLSTFFRFSPKPMFSATFK